MAVVFMLAVAFLGCVMISLLVFLLALSNVEALHRSPALYPVQATLRTRHFQENSSCDICCFYRRGRRDRRITRVPYKVPPAYSKPGRPPIPSLVAGVGL